MRTILLASTLALAGAAALAAEPAAKPAATHMTQGERMKSCSADAKAKSLKGDERKSFMSGCLKKKPEAAKA